MREIKFRAWDKFKDVPDMVYFDLDILQEGKTVLIGSIVDTELMQYTGLKDKNGKEAYENDIVSVDNVLAEVIYESEFGGFFAQVLENPELRARLDHPRIEVVGNRYENPELLSSDNK